MIVAKFDQLGLARMHEREEMRARYALEDGEPVAQPAQPHESEGRRAKAHASGGKRHGTLRDSHTPSLCHGAVQQVQTPVLCRERSV